MTTKYTLIDLAAGGPHYKRQPRDRHGRWTDTGARAISAAKDVAKRALRSPSPLENVRTPADRERAKNFLRASLQKEREERLPLRQRRAGERLAGQQFHWDKKIDDATKRVHAKALVSEPGITADLKANIGSGRLEGLNYRLKAPDSLARKIRDLADNEFGHDVKAAEADIKDAVRYTAIWDRDKIVPESEALLADLKRKGHKVAKIKNYLGAEPGPMGYRGVNAQMVAPDGHRYELQFHTPESFEAKMGRGHEIYEAWRVLPPDSPKRKRLEEESWAFYAVKVPPIPGAEMLDGK